MAVYVDDAYIETAPGTVLSRRAIWCHLTADTKDELHRFALLIGLQRTWFQDKKHGLWHYDVTKTVRAKAVKHGAIEISWRDMADNPDSVWTRPGREGREIHDSGKGIKGQHPELDTDACMQYNPPDSNTALHG